jgi:hypothetical protein
MIERREGNPFERKIQLFSKEDKINLYGVNFAGKKKPIEDKAYAQLVGSRGITYPEETLGLQLAYDKLVIDQADKHMRQNNFDIMVRANNLALARKDTIGWTCYLYLPDSEQYLSSRIHQSVRKNENDEEVVQGITLFWNKPHDNIQYRFFVPQDPEILEQLRFAFVPPPEKRKFTIGTFS